MRCSGFPRITQRSSHHKLLITAVRAVVVSCTSAAAYKPLSVSNSHILSNAGPTPVFRARTAVYRTQRVFLREKLTVECLHRELSTSRARKMAQDEMQAWGEAGKKYTIHEETLAYFRKLRKLGFKTYEELTPEELRGQLLRRTELFAGHPNFNGSETEYHVPCGEDYPSVPVSVYKPADVSTVPAILVYFHGGGLVAGSRNTVQPFLKNIASRARCIVVNVEYRLAPEHKAPAAFDDCRTATRWVLQNKTVIGGHKDSQVGVGGDSAGGQLTASITHDVTGLAFQILVYPVLDLTQTTPSYREFVKTPGLNAVGMSWYIQHFIADENQKGDPVICPSLRPNSSFKGLPPALCFIAELDPLRDEGQAYFQRLKEAGVSTEVTLVKGAPHAFFLLSDHFKQLTKEPHQKVIDFVKRFQTD